jgi:hypothetical protein
MTTITSGMTGAAYITALNANFAELATYWGVGANSMTTITSSMTPADRLKAINNNFRATVLIVGMTGVAMIESLNNTFSKSEKVRRFQDYIKENLWLQGECSALVTDDGTQMDVWSDLGYCYTTDGLSFSVIETCTWNGYTSIQCLTTVKVDGVYYCTASSLDGESVKGIRLFTSTDKYTWTYVATLVTLTTVIGSWVIGGVGNSFLFKDGTTYYLFFEMWENVGNNWRIWLASASALDGEWTFVENPIVPYSGTADGTGNPELVQINNLPYKHEGKFYMTYHYDTTHAATQGIYRAYSYDLLTWVVEGNMLDTRVAPMQVPWSNGDQCLCQFKGRTFMFYTNNANGGGANMHTDMNVDNLPLTELLSLYP